MRVGLQGWGSEGDLRPMVALAAGLRRAGHEVRLELTVVDGKDYGPLCQAEGIPLRLTPDNPDFALHTVAKDADSVDPLKVSRELVERTFNPFLDQLYEAALELCAASDLVIWHYSCWYTKAAAVKTGTPHVALHLFPGLVPTGTVPPPGLPNVGMLNRAFWGLAGLILDRQFLRRPRRFFLARGLPPPRHVLPDLLFSEHLNLHAASPALIPPAPDWGPEHAVIGPLTLRRASEPWCPSPALAAFLEEGPPPVLLSAGSMEHFAPRRARDLLIAAARAAGVRAIIQSKREPAVEERDDELFFLPWAPHDALLPRCTAMVHHGGAGTSHAALRAGLPAVVLPFIFEQQAWANRLHAAGVAPKAVRFWKATPELLAQRIREATTHQAYRERAQALSRSLAAEDGVAVAIQKLEALLARSRR